MNETDLRATSGGLPFTSSRRALQLLLAAAGVVFVANLLRYRGYLLDDTFISLRYARNLVDGYGLVFNPNERVEGYTNFLFVLVAALCLKVGVEPIAALKWLGGGLSLCALWLTARLERLGRPRHAEPLAVSIAVLLLLPL